MPRPTDTRIAMTDDERAIRNVVDTWITASKTGDVATVLSLITDDAVFMTPGQPPFGKEAFAKMLSLIHI